MIPSHNLLVIALREPKSTSSLQPVEWDLLVRQARRAALLARLCVLFEEQGLLDTVPLRVQDHLVSARIEAEAHERNVRWEAYQIRQALEGLNIPVVLLKGAAYTLNKLPVGRGRTFYDVDILVPKINLEVVEQALLRQGWLLTHLDDYDQRYYRQWMHQLPPLRHVKRQSVLDVHHTILPETARLSPDPDKLVAASRPLQDQGCLRILAPTDMVLHSATHLFHDGEFDHGLRDLVDLDSLLRDFGQNETFFSELVRRAKELDLTRPLYYALRYAEAFLGTPIPGPEKHKTYAARPGGLAAPFMDAMFTLALAPDHPSCDTRFTGLARWLIYVRGHALRMPLYLLVTHLIRKAIKRRKEKA
jgi:hypothetical protein